jgi:hypothetical protein
MCFPWLNVFRHYLSKAPNKFHIRRRVMAY